MLESIELFVQYTTLTEPTPQGQIERYQQLLRDIASGTWTFSAEFQAWAAKSGNLTQMPGAA